MPDQPQDNAKKPVVPPPSEQTPVVRPGAQNLPLQPPSEFRLQPSVNAPPLLPPSDAWTPQRSTNEVSRFSPPQGGWFTHVENPPPPPPLPFFPEQAPKPVTPAQAMEIFKALAAMPDIAFGFAKDGCYARAHLMAQRLIDMGQTPSKAWAFEGENGRLLLHARDGTKINWWYHVAPTIPVQMPDGAVQQMVMDPSMFDGPTTPDRWGTMMNADRDAVSVRGLNDQLPKHLGDYMPGYRTGDWTTGHAEQTMQEYVPQQKPGPRKVFACDLDACVNMSSLSPEDAALAEHQPARRFEIRTGLTGIAGDYQFPDGQTATQFEGRHRWMFLPEGSVPPPALVEGGLVTTTQPAHLPLETLTSLTPQVSEFYARTWDRLVELNPVLKDIKLDRANTVELSHAIFGVSSGFNANDINYYLERNRAGVPVGAYFNDPRFRWVEGESGARPEWIASPETLTAMTDGVAAAKGVPPLHIDGSRFTGIGNTGAASIGIVLGGMGLKDAIERGDTVGGVLAGTNVVTSVAQATEGVAAATGRTIPALTNAGKFVPVLNIGLTVADGVYQISKEDTTQHRVERGAVVGATATTGIVLAGAAATTGEAAAITTAVTGFLGTGVAGTGTAAVTVAAAPVVLTVVAVGAVAYTGDAALKAKRAWDDVDETIARNGAAQKREGYKSEDGKPSVLAYKHIAVSLLHHSENMKNENMNGTAGLPRDERGRFKIQDFKKIDLRDPKNVAELERVLQASIKKQDDILKANSNFLDYVLPKWMAHGGDTLDKITMAQMERADLAGAMQELQMYKKEMRDWDAAHPDNPATTGVQPVVPGQKPKAGTPARK